MTATKPIKYPHTDNFKSVIYEVKKQSSSSGKLPTLNFIGTTKIHGSNHSWKFDAINETLEVQSRNNILNEKLDPFGFYSFSISIHNQIKPILQRIAISTNSKMVVLYGEWAGKGVQKSFNL